MPSVVKVENVYQYNNSTDNKKTELHLRVLLKALLDEFQQMKDKTGVVPNIDEGVLNMIH